MLSKVSVLSLLLVSTVTAYDNGARFARLPTLGWSSWVALGPDASPAVFDYCDEFSVKAAADAFIEVGLYDAGYRHFHLDDCWAATERNASGFLMPEADHFPNGMKPVVDYVKSKGLVFGLYTCGGPKTCVGNREGSQGHWVEDAQVFAEWGVEWVKMDWCYGNDILGSYGNMSKALNATGFPIVSYSPNNPIGKGKRVRNTTVFSGLDLRVSISTQDSTSAKKFRTLIG